MRFLLVSWLLPFGAILDLRLILLGALIGCYMMALW